MNKLTEWYITHLTALADTQHGDVAIPLLTTEYERLLKESGEERRFDVILTEPADRKIAEIKSLRVNFPGLGLKDAKSISDALRAVGPQRIAHDLDRESAEELIREIARSGATLEAVPVGEWLEPIIMDRVFYKVVISDLPRTPDGNVSMAGLADVMDILFQYDLADEHVQTQLVNVIDEGHRMVIDGDISDKTSCTDLVTELTHMGATVEVVPQ